MALPESLPLCRALYNRSMRNLLLLMCLALVLSHDLAAFSFDEHSAKAREAASRGDLNTAEREYQAALREVRKRPGDMRVFLAYEGLSNVAERQHDAEAAEEYLKQGLAARREAGTGPVAELPAWLDLKRFYSGQKRWLDAAMAADRLAGIWKECGAGAEAGTAQYLSAAGLLYHSAGEYAKAEERYRAAVPILEAMGQSAALAHVVIRLANTLAAEDKRDEAEAQFKRAMTMTQKTRWQGSAGRDYSDFLRRHGRDDEAVALEKSRPSLAPARVARGVTSPQPISRHEPEYTETARSRRIVGSVLLYIEVDPSGAPVNIQVLEPLGFGLDEKAIAAVETWRFRPGTKDGQPVTVAATIEVNFRLF